MPINIQYSHTKPIRLNRDENHEWAWSTGEARKFSLNYNDDNNNNELQSIVMTTKPEGDYWRRTHYNFIHDNGDFLYLKSLKATINQNYEIQVSFKANYQNLYDQAGIMLRSGEKNWIKTGIEYVHGIFNASAVVTREYSDWSTNPLLNFNNNNQQDQYFTIKVQLFKGDVRVDYSLDEGITWNLLRIAHLFDLTTTATNDEHADTDNQSFLELGIFAASPTNNSSSAEEGFQVEFKNLSITELLTI